MYLALLQSASFNVTIVEGSSMGLGAELIPLPSKFVALPDVFTAASTRDKLVHDYRTLWVTNAIGGLIANEWTERASTTLTMTKVN